MYPFEISVYTYTRPNLRKDEYKAFIGFGFLEKLFDSEDKIEDESLVLIFPERWLNILEQRGLFEVIQVRCKNMKRVEITTTSLFIMQVTPNGSMYVVDDPKKYPETKYSLGVRYCPKDFFLKKIVKS